MLLSINAAMWCWYDGDKYGHEVDVVNEQLSHDPTSARRARRIVASTLSQAGLDDLVEAAELLISELVANVLLHTRSDAKITITIDDGAVTVAVYDRSPAMPVRKAYGADAATGRGLRLLETYAAAWGAAPDDDGKRVWFVLDSAAAQDDPSPEGTEDGHEAGPVDLDSLAASLGEDIATGEPTNLRRCA